MEGVFAKLRNLDAYPKINEDFYSRTLSGGIITIVSSIVMFLLFVSELLQFDVTFPALSCSMLSLDAMDISGEEHLDVVCNTFVLFACA
ncbi:hypothetical protein BHE74_00052866 [Ensete ventricosum]|uniref:Endoplasmic reticulum vesicle transporter N-terminal domain-containing protein n=1 Tax=Ensete ventricosum TaxID=4639 RepID=A0A426Z3E0_ENSVE|nr:hypothetical protein B296_00046600 [Ensete ventricosum]RWW41638.1 hypothetical protein BHE74_00052866 [Ensete ventricosum]RZS26074.1 hypothetical protein BHM03_00059386 [Ensete ventricosum]